MDVGERGLRRGGAALRALCGRSASAIVLLLGAVALSTGCAFKAPDGRANASMSALGVDKRPYQIRVGDSLDVRFYKTPELNVEKVPVRSDGKISLDLVGDVQAAGLGPDELATDLVQDYSKELESPKIAVIVRSFGGQVYVAGEVSKPSSLAFSEGLTALQAIEGAGGFADTASLENVVLIRRAVDHYEGYRLFLKKALSGEDYEQDVALQPNDVVYVPKSRVANLNLLVSQYINKMIPQIPIALPIF